MVCNHVILEVEENDISASSFGFVQGHYTCERPGWDSYGRKLGIPVLLRSLDNSEK